MAVADGAGLPLAVAIASASPAEVTLVEHTLKQQFRRASPERLIGDKAYDSDKLDALRAGRHPEDEEPVEPEEEATP